LPELPKLPKIAEIETHIFSGAGFQLSVVLLASWQFQRLWQFSDDLPILL